MYQFILLIHVFVAVCVVALVLVQQGKGATLGAAFGGASQTIFGARGSSSFLFRLTIGLIITFFITSITLNYLTTRAYKQAKVISLPATPAVPITPRPMTKAPEQQPVEQMTPPPPAQESVTKTPPVVEPAQTAATAAPPAQTVPTQKKISKQKISRQKIKKPTNASVQHS